MTLLRRTVTTAGNAWLLQPWARPCLFSLSLLPFAWLAFAAFTDRLGANPAEALVRATGDWTLRFLCITLAVTPLRVVLGLPALARLRRMFGLFTYFYATWHLMAYAWFDMGLDLGDITRDIAKRPFILVGFAAFTGLTLLAATSFNRAIRALGAVNWRRLHRAVYAIAFLALLHFLWMRAAKNNLGEVAVYAALVSLLLGWRLARWWRERRQRMAPQAVLRG